MCPYAIWNEKNGITTIMCEPKNEMCTLCVIGNRSTYNEITQKSQKGVGVGRVININIGTPMLAHYCPNCWTEVFYNSSVKFDEERICGIGKCPRCKTELQFPNTEELLKLLP